MEWTTSLPGGLSFRQPAVLTATCLGVGLLPVAPGTWASLAALPLGWIVHGALGPAGVAAAAALAFAVGWWAAARVVARSGADDPSCIVIDEVAGQLLALAAAPPGIAPYLAAFLGFRLFDIVKPWPAGWADRTLKGGFGVMLDDVFAGLYAGAAVFAATRFDFL